MKIKCIEAKQYPNLTTGKDYNVESVVSESQANVIYVTDDNKEVLGFPFELFENIDLKGL